MKNQVCLDAAGVEIRAWEDQHTWDIKELPSGKKALGSRWVFTKKYRTDGTITRHKERLVIIGNHQTKGLDYSKTFSPVAKMTMV